MTTFRNINTPLMAFAVGCGLTALTSCADQFDQEYSVDRPALKGEYAYLNDYTPLKEYLGNPNVKLGVGTDAREYLQQQLVYALTNSNFNETVSGNDMKMASCVNDKGEMNFGTVSEYVSAATDAGLSVYGHTLAWHSQQPVKYLSSLLKDKELDIDPDAKEEKEEYKMDWAAATAYTMWGQFPDIATVSTNGALTITTTGTIANFWELQYMVADGISLQAGKEYVMRLELKGSPASENLHYVIGPWGADIKAGVLDFTTDWETRDIAFTAPNDASGVHMLLQSGDYEGEYSIKSVTLYSLEAPVVEVPSYIYENDFSGSDVPGGWGNNSTRTIEDGVLHVNNPSTTDFWAAQMAIDGYQFEQGVTYYMSLKIKGSGNGVWRSGAQVTSDYSSAGDFPNIEFGTEWKDFTVKFTCNKEGATRWIHSFGDFAGDIYIDDLKLYVMKSMNAIPLTEQEKKDTLTWAMANWIEGMMNACDGKVKAWDVVNEAISGADTDGDGFYDLQHGSEGNTTDFFWQDYLGDIDYVRTAVRLARQYGPEDVKLFINDYNLESDWDDNKKLKSLIEWIDRWEADGVTKIDGIGSQMHISCYMNANVQEKKKKAIENMFRLMAQTGKLVRVSELDMGLVDENGNDVQTANATEAQLHEMADLYKFVVSKYFEIVPAAQQWGICQWAATDSPANSGWRPNSPLGLWDLNYNRKHAYAGFADGLQSK